MLQTCMAAVCWSSLAKVHTRFLSHADNPKRTSTETHIHTSTDTHTHTNKKTQAAWHSFWQGQGSMECRTLTHCKPPVYTVISSASHSGLSSAILFPPTWIHQTSLPEPSSLNFVTWPGKSRITRAPCRTLNPKLLNPKKS